MMNGMLVSDTFIYGRRETFYGAANTAKCDTKSHGTHTKKMQHTFLLSLGTTL